MILRVVTCLILILSIVIGVSAQDESTNDAPLSIENPVEDISLSHNPDTSTISLNLRGVQPDGCEYPIVTEAELNENRIDVRFVRMIESEAQDTSICTDVVLVVEGTAEVTYDATALSAHDALIVAVNGEPLVETKISLLPSSTDEAPVFYFDTLIPVQRFDLPISSLELRPALEGSPYGSIIVTGEQTACEATIEETQSLRETTLSIEVYKSIDSTSECAQTLIPFEITFPIRQPVSGATTVNVNGVQIEHGFRILPTADGDGNPIDVSPIARPTAMPFNTEAVPIRIDELLVSIDNNGDMPRLLVTARGEHPDGCDFPLNADVQQEGEMISVQLTREVNLDLMCPMVLNPYEHTFDLGAFETGTYQLDINGISVEVSL